jgi:hypothetical protein
MAGFWLFKRNNYPAVLLKNLLIEDYMDRIYEGSQIFVREKFEKDLDTDGKSVYKPA